VVTPVSVTQIGFDPSPNDPLTARTASIVFSELAVEASPA